MKSVFKPLSFVAMAISFTMSTLVLAETTAPAATAPAATAADTSTAATKPVVHHHKHIVKDPAKATDTANPVAAEKAAASSATEPAKTK
jgi:hypothetical protein